MGIWGATVEGEGRIELKKRFQIALQVSIRNSKVVVA
jgi:hypothetical protein